MATSLFSLPVILALLFALANAGIVPDCTSYDASNICITCAPTYILVQGQCYSKNPLCASYDLSTGVCLTCIPGFILNGYNCYNNTPIDPYCAQYSGSVCALCRSGYFFNGNGKCENSCVVFNPLNGYCNSCKTGFVLNNGKCLYSGSGSSATNIYCKTFSNGACS
jgi:hypothetical protein